MHSSSLLLETLGKLVVHCVFTMHEIISTFYLYVYRDSDYDVYTHFNFALLVFAQPFKEIATSIYECAINVLLFFANALRQH